MIFSHGRVAGGLAGRPEREGEMRGDHQIDGALMVELERFCGSDCRSFMLAADLTFCSLNAYYMLSSTADDLIWFIAAGARKFERN